MKAAEVIAALELPSHARVDRRVPKTLLVEHGAPTSADRRRITEGIEEMHWLAALKPTTIGVPTYRDETREYLEIAVLSAVLREGAKTERLAALVHRAVPYPLFLIGAESERLTLSVSHKRWSQGEAGATVLDGDLVVATLPATEVEEIEAAFVESLSLARQPRGNLFLLYQGWLDTLLALLASRLTGAFRAVESPDQGAARQQALRECARLDTEIARLRLAASKEKQMSRRVELNLEVKRCEAALATAQVRLG